MEPLDQYANIQPLVQKDISDAIDRLETKNQYEVVKIPAHTHNGADSLPIAFTDLSGVNQYAALSRMSLTSAQILTLNTVPVVLVPQPGALSVIIVDSITVRLVYGSAAYTGLHNLEFHYTDGNGPQVTDSIPPTFINSSASAYYHAPAVSGSFIPVPGGSGNNGRIVAFVNTANPAAGNSSITIVTKYRIVPFVA